MHQFYSPSLRLDQSAIRPARAHPAVRPVSARVRRRLVSSLRRLASTGLPRGAAPRRQQVILHHRVAPVRVDLLEIAALLECTAEPDTGCVATLHRLLTDGCESPIYNPDVHPSELRATLYYVRSRLVAA